MPYALVEARRVLADRRTGAVNRTAQGFAELLSAHWAHLYRFAYHLTGNRDDADDLIQQAAEEALRAFGRFRPGTRFDRWFMRILYTAFIDRVRRQRRRSVASLDDIPHAAIPADPAADPETLVARWIDGPVRRALASLPAEYRAAVVLIDMHEMSYDEAAAILHCPVGTVRSRLHRGRLALREWLRPYVDAMKRGDL